MRKVQLEKIYLMNVALHLHTYRDVYRFIQVNNKCLQSMNELNVNPSFKNIQSLQSYLKRFSPQTINCGNGFMEVNEKHLNCSLLRNPMFKITNNQKQVVSLFSKIHSLQLHDIEAVKEFVDLVIEYAVEFNKLKKIYGDLNIILKFMRNYTKNGTELFVPMPELLIIDLNNNQMMHLNEDTVAKLKELLSYIVLPERMKIVCLFNEHPLNTPMNNELLKQLNKIDYYYISMTENTCRYKQDCYLSECGKIKFRNTIGNNSFNKFITDSYSNCICIGSQNTVIELKENDEENNRIINDDSESDDDEEEMKEKENKNNHKEVWKLPECVDEVIISKVQKEGIDPHRMGQGKIELHIDMRNIQKLHLQNTYGISLNQNFPLLEELRLVDVWHFSIGNSDNLFTLKNLKQIAIMHCGVGIVFIKSKQLKLIDISNSHFVSVSGEFDSVEELFVDNSIRATFSKFPFENKRITIENCESIAFYENGKEINPLDYLGISTDEFTNLCRHAIHLPDSPIDLVTYKNLYVVPHYRDFNLSMLREDGWIKKESSMSYFSLNILFNYFFTQNLNKTLYIKIKRPQNEQTQQLLSLLKEKNNQSEIDLQHLQELNNNDNNNSQTFNQILRQIIHLSGVETKGYQILENDDEIVSIMLHLKIIYFEFTLKGYSIVSLGFINLNDFELNGQHIGTSRGQIGLFSDNGKLYQSSPSGVPYTDHFGQNENEIHTIGVGYDIEKKELFYTKNKKKLSPTIKVDWLNIGSALSIKEFEYLKINYGDKPFEFDLLQEYYDNGYI